MTSLVILSSLQLILMYCEIEAHEKVIEQLLAGLANKNPKVLVIEFY